MTIQQDVLAQFHAHFDAKPTFFVRAPGRVNLIGEHTDYNEGFVMPMAIDRAVYIALRPRADDTVLIHSLDFEAPIHFQINHMHKDASSPAEYVKGVMWALQERGLPLSGWEGVMKGDVPIGAGLSSSAALELAIARASAAVGDFAWDAKAMALSAQKAENQWVGVQCGIMDQMISAVGQANHAVMIDCRDYSTTALPLPPETVVVVLDTNTRRGLVDSLYNERRQQCEAAAHFFGVKVLRDVTLAAFEAQASALPTLTYQRARHVITENARVIAARDAMLAGDAETLGALMLASHISLRDDFEVSSPALNQVVDVAQAHAACYGGRMTGAGFGGCGVALVAATGVADFVAHVQESYTDQRQAGIPMPTVYVCVATDGASLLTLT